MKSKIDAINQHKAPSHRVGSGKYEVMEHLGSGAFGSVYRVRAKPPKDRQFKPDEHKFYAMKEVDRERERERERREIREFFFGRVA